MDVFMFYVCTVYNNMFLCFFHACFYILLEICKIRPVRLSHIALLPSFMAPFSCSILHWVVILRGWYCAVILLWSRHRGYTNSRPINNSNGIAVTVLKEIRPTYNDGQC